MSVLLEIVTRRKLKSGAHSERAKELVLHLAGPDLRALARRVAERYFADHPNLHRVVARLADEQGRVTEEVVRLERPV